MAEKVAKIYRTSRVFTVESHRLLFKIY
jgi:hypothetical protein